MIKLSEADKEMTQILNDIIDIMEIKYNQSEKLNADYSNFSLNVSMGMLSYFIHNSTKSEFRKEVIVYVAKRINEYLKAYDAELGEKS